MGREEIQARIDELKTECGVCGITDKDVLMFHHKNPILKECRVGPHLTMATLEKEAQKCQVLCFNCHVKFHRKHPAKSVVRKDKPLRLESIEREVKRTKRELSSLSSLSTERLMAISEKCNMIINTRRQNPAYLKV